MSYNENNSNDMIVFVAGDDCSESLGLSLREGASLLENHTLSNRLSGELQIAELSKIHNEEEYLSRQLEIMGTRTQIDLNKCELPDSSSGGVSKKIIGYLRGLLWRMLRFAPDWVVFHQNTVNEQLMISMAHEVRLRRRENKELCRRIELLESAIELHNGGDS